MPCESHGLVHDFVINPYFWSKSDRFRREIHFVRKSLLYSDFESNSQPCFASLLQTKVPPNLADHHGPLFLAFGVGVVSNDAVFEDTTPSCLAELSQSQLLQNHEGWSPWSLVSDRSPPPRCVRLLQETGQN